MGNRVALSNQLIMRDDKEYLDNFYHVFELIRQKMFIARKVRDHLSGRNTELSNQEKVKEFMEEIARLNKELREKDTLFWRKVEYSRKKGIEFILEKLFASYGLDNYEKRIVLYLFYLKLFCPHYEDCPVSEMLDIFDFGGSLYERICNLKYFDSSSPLIKKGILVKEKWYRLGRAEDAIMHLSSDIAYSMAFVLEEKQLPEEDGRRYGKVGSSDDIGYVKKPEYTMDDVVLKEDIKDKVLFLLNSQEVENLESLGVYERVKKGRGLVFLFYGPPGTGKSILAEAIANYLNKNLLIVEFPKITSMWFGQTEKNIAKVFKIAKNDNLVICIDEADTLLYNRRYAIQEHDIRFVNVVLREIESFEGEIILTTNMDILLDPALERRATLKIKFRLPDEDMRERIWRLHMPGRVKVSEDVDFKFLARRFKFSGGNIKNAVLNALRRIASERRNILTMDDLLFGGLVEEEGCFIRENRGTIGFH